MSTMISADKLLIEMQKFCGGCYERCYHKKYDPERDQCNNGLCPMRFVADLIGAEVIHAKREEEIIEGIRKTVPDNVQPKKIPLNKSGRKCPCCGQIWDRATYCLGCGTKMPPLKEGYDEFSI